MYGGDARSIGRCKASHSPNITSTREKCFRRPIATLAYMCALSRVADATSYLFAGTLHYRLPNTIASCCRIDSYRCSHVVYLHLYIFLCTGRIFCLTCIVAE